MTALWRAGAAALCCGALVSTALVAQQRDTRRVTPSGGPPPAPVGTAAVRGSVVADATGAPVAYASVALIGARTGVLKVASTDRSGAFGFAALPADRYTVAVSKLPYLGAIAGARRPGRPGVPIVLADAATVDALTIRLTMGSAISGTLFDAQGRPAAGGSVIAQQRKMQNGERVLVGVPGGTTQADDQGRYRIHGLPPGEYLISVLGIHNTVAGIPEVTDAEVDAVLAGQRPTAPVVPAPIVPAIHAPVYFPGTTRVAEAAGVLLAPGDDRQNVDIRWEAALPTRIDGIVSTADGSPLPQVTVMIAAVQGSGPLQFTTTVRVTPDGRFTSAQPLPPGTYALIARAPNAFAIATVEANGTDISGLPLVLQPPVSIAGRIVTAGEGRPPVIAGQRLQLTAMAAAMRSAPAQITPATATGEFRVTLPPGQYMVTGAPFFGASPDSVTWGLGTITVDGHDVTDRPIDVRPDAVPKEIIATFTNQWQDVSGRVTNAQGHAVSDYTMLLFPVDEAYWIYGSRRHVAATPDSDGHYRLGGPGPALLPAGDYYLAAVTDVTKDEQYDPAFLKSLIPAAIRLSLGAGQKVTQDVRVQ